MSEQHSLKNVFLKKKENPRHSKHNIYNAQYSIKSNRHTSNQKKSISTIETYP